MEVDSRTNGAAFDGLWLGRKRTEPALCLHKAGGDETGGAQRLRHSAAVPTGAKKPSAIRRPGFKSRRTSLKPAAASGQTQWRGG